MSAAEESMLPTGRTLSIRADEVKRLRLQNGWSIEDLAAKAGCSPKTVHNVENGEKAYLSTIKKFAKAFAIEVGGLLAEAGQDLTPQAAAPSTATRIRVSIVVDIPFQEFSESGELVALLQLLREAINAKGEFHVSGIHRSSVLIEMEMDEDDFLEMLKAFYEVRMDALRIAEIVLPLPWLDLMTRPRQEPKDFLDKVRDIWEGHGALESEIVECKKDYKVRGTHKVFGPDPVSYISFKRTKSPPRGSMQVTATTDREEAESEGDPETG